ncbi:hypothetical protein [Cloacibacillus evryensis]|uniref:hypothetical protein n=1 Tax=Cloacibacillus evryensis TaxID=508460 RepID=UPI002B1F574E|nr:hypothetical protein [Cloacibacillus evryensis]MEA5034227.1 hypothetical protein [Cloacibacillus evryensis]
MTFTENSVSHTGHADTPERCAFYSTLMGIMEVAADMYADEYTLHVKDGERSLFWTGDLEKIKRVVEEVSIHG